MQEFTFEKNVAAKLETYEWDNVWWEQTANTTAKRVLYIGDSISCGIRRIATEVSGNEILFDGFGTSKGLDNPYFQPTLKLCMGQQARCDAILFNNGLHAWHLSTETYELAFADMVAFLRSQYAGPIFVVLTTDTPKDPNGQKTVDARNAAARRVAAEIGVGVIDLASKAQEYTALHTDDGVHFTEEGYRKLAAFIVDEIKNEI